VVSVVAHPCEKAETQPGRQGKSIPDSPGRCHVIFSSPVFECDVAGTGRRRPSAPLTTISGITTKSSRLSEPRYPSSHPIHAEVQMPDALESPSPPSAPRGRSIAARRAARRAKFDREKRIVMLLNGGVSIAEVAAREGVTVKRMHAFIREILPRRAPQPPAEFLALQISRNEALIVSYNAMSRANLEAVDRVVRIVRELDRYHGFAAAEPARFPVASRLAARRASLLRSRRRKDGRKELAPQAIESPRFAPGRKWTPFSRSREKAPRRAE
jgi:hypothetical protein